MIVKKYKDIKHLIPEDSIYNDDRNEIVLYHKGDWAIELPINLDFADKLYQDYTYEELPSFILIEGNLNSKNIFNFETDGSTGLIVLGNLSAENIVVGGQEIYITGDLNVSGLYWGDYNHGNLQTKGNINIRVFIETDYGYDHNRFIKSENINIPYLLLDENEEYKSGNWIRALLRPEFILSEKEIYEYEDQIWSWSSWINSKKLFDALENSEPILLSSEKVNQSVFPKPEVIPFLFENVSISYENIQVFYKSTLVESYEGFPATFKFYEYWKDDIFKRVFINNENIDATQVYFQYKKEYNVYIAINPTDKKLVFCFSENVFDSNKAEILDINKNKKYFDFFEEQWILFQKEYSEAVFYQHQFHQVVNQNDFESILNLPVVKEKYSDYNNDDSICYFYDYCWKFRQASKEDSSRITIAFELENEEFTFFHFEMYNNVPVLLTQNGNGYEFTPYEISFSDSFKYKEAIKLFKILKNNIINEN